MEESGGVGEIVKKKGRKPGEPHQPRITPEPLIALWVESGSLLLHTACDRCVVR